MLHRCLLSAFCKRIMRCCWFRVDALEIRFVWFWGRRLQQSISSIVLFQGEELDYNAYLLLQ